ncbi:hypothetical protein F4781DRAFT_428636 [Annulohypoxylon bovei var. microspora]|nr:hypothetical protein F4781DRAFT_428636 [Annulohypoxylon bovei var. microspora]
MRFQVATIAGLLMVGQAVAAPAPSAPLTARDGKTAAEIIGEISPNSKTCDGSAECRTADQIGPLMADAMLKYGVYSPGQIAGIIALTAFETVDYKYKHNVSPGRAGQGTSNMQQFNYNLQYAQSIPALKSQVTGVDVNAADDKRNEVLALVTPDEYNFGSGPWFLTTQCTSAVQEALKKGDDAGFEQYMGCVGVTLTQQRTDYWTRAKSAFGLA